MNEWMYARLNIKLKQKAFYEFYRVKQFFKQKLHYKSKGNYFWTNNYTKAVLFVQKCYWTMKTILLKIICSKVPFICSKVEFYLFKSAIEQRYFVVC